MKLENQHFDSGLEKALASEFGILINFSEHNQKPPANHGPILRVSLKKLRARTSDPLEQAESHTSDSCKQTTGAILRAAYQLPKPSFFRLPIGSYDRFIIKPTKMVYNRNLQK